MTSLGDKKIYLVVGKQRIIEKEKEESPEASLWPSPITSYHSAIYNLFPKDPFSVTFKCHSQIVLSPQIYSSAPVVFYEEPEAGNCGNSSCYWFLEEDEPSREIFVDLSLL